MDIKKIAVLGLTGAIFAVVLKEKSQVFSLMISVITALVIFIFLLPYVAHIVNLITSIESKLNINKSYIKILVKALIISYISMFTSSLCKDFNQQAIGDKVELAAKISIMSLSAPLIYELIESVWNIF